MSCKTLVSVGTSCASQGRPPQTGCSSPRFFFAPARPPPRRHLTFNMRGPPADRHSLSSGLGGVQFAPSPPRSGLSGFDRLCSSGRLAPQTGDEPKRSLSPVETVSRHFWHVVRRLSRCQVGFPLEVYGSSFFESAEVDSWLDWSLMEFDEPPMSLENALDVLEKHLEQKAPC